MGSLVFVHGTGVRLDGYKHSLDAVKAGSKRAGFDWDVVSCAWGDPLGILFEGKSLPDPPSETELAAEAAEEARWSWLYDDPLFELNALTIRGVHAEVPVAPPGREPAWKTAWNRVAGYRPGREFGLLLERAGLAQDWESAWTEIIASEVSLRAVEASAAENELADAFVALARAVIATMYVQADDEGRAAPPRALREALRARLVEDWGYNVFGLKAFVTDLFARAATRTLRRRRNKFNAVAALPLGDILLYQGRGAEIRGFIRGTIEEAAPPVTVIAHSLGGIAAFDLLAADGAPAVSHLITIGSQAPFFYEIGALQSLREPEQPAPVFPPWLNIYDRNDFLSFIGENLFPGRVTDREVHSGQPFPQAHSAYAGSDEVWTHIREFIPA